MVSRTPGRGGGLLGVFARDPYRYAAVVLALTMALMYIWSVSLDGMGDVNALFATGKGWMPPPLAAPHRQCGGVNIPPQQKGRLLTHSPTSSFPTNAHNHL